MLRLVQALRDVAVLGLAVALGVSNGCVPDTPRGEAVALLRGRFPRHADRVLGIRGDHLPVTVSDGTFAFAPGRDPDPVRAAEAALAARGALRASLPARGDGAVRLSLADGFAIEVREAGLRGPGRVERGAVVYERDGGAGSFWSATARGYEEWLLVRPGAGGGAVATWEVTGGALRGQGESVEVRDGRGRARLRVTAPAAYAASGAPLRTRLTVDGNRLALTIEGGAGAELVLVDPEWQVTGAMGAARYGHTATLLPSGQVLLAGGYGSTGYLATAELYDPVTGTLAPTAGDLIHARYNHTATLLPSGKVLLVGGYDTTALASAELYDPATGSFAATGALATGRIEPTATLLPSGKVLVVGGATTVSPWFIGTAELYDPVAGSFAPTTGPLAAARYGHTATLLPSGKVLVAGGAGSTGALATAELYDPTAATFAPAGGPLATARQGHTATLLPSGKVLVTGGKNGSVRLASAELYDPVATTFAATTGPLATARDEHTATLLPSGEVLVAGGYGTDGGVLATAEVYDPEAGTFAATTSPLATARGSHTATLLPSGQVLLAGGKETGNTYVASTELYDPLMGSFASASGALGARRLRHTATPLPSGHVLLAGGYGTSGAIASAELFDVAAGTFAPTAGPLTTSRAYHTATLLLSGKVLLVGGTGASGATLASAELYDPVARTFAPTVGSLATGRSWHTATLLPSGKVLVVGGASAGNTPLASAELYDPATGTFAPTAGPLATTRSLHTATLLPSGKVLVVGGDHGSNSLLASAEVYDPVTETFAPTGPLTSARRYHTATLLPAGQVLVAGGYGTGGATLASAEVYDPASGSFAPTGSLVGARFAHTATLLPSARVLLVGGRSGTTYLQSATLYDPLAGVFTPVPSPLDQSRAEHTATLLPSGKVLLAGGGTVTGTLASAELYDEGRGAPAASAPTLAGPLPTVRPGDSLALEGALFDGVSEASSGGTSSSATNFPVLLLRRIDSEAMTHFPTTAWTPPPAAAPTATAASAVVPTTAVPGPYLAWVVANGVLSNGVGVAVEPLPQGAACRVDVACASLRCIDGYCCDATCSAAATVGRCEACDGARRGWPGATNGTCATAPAGFAGDPACVSSSLACNGTDPACASSCATDADCAPDRYCEPNGACLLRRTLGQTCADGDCQAPPCRECASGHCVDGVCCDTACADPCWSCRLSGHAGACTASPAGDDDEGRCSLGSGVCRQACDGNGACAYPDATKLCTGSTETCTEGIIQSPDHCNGAGTCVTGATTPCPGGYQCAGYQPVCLTDCTGNRECRLGYYCEDAECKPGKANGQPCGGNAECTSGNCIDGVCCDRSCDGACHYCKFAGSEGICQPVPDGQDPRGECQASSGGSTACAGVCQSAQCAFPDLGTRCGQCSTCDGTGRCSETPVDDESCGTVACSGLDTPCRTYHDLTANRCAALGVCKAPNDPATCTLYTDLSCNDGGGAQQDAGTGQEDGGAAQQDAGAGPPGQDGGPGTGSSGGCAVAPAAPAGGGLLLLVAALLTGRRRRR